MRHISALVGLGVCASAAPALGQPAPINPTPLIIDQSRLDRAPPLAAPVKPHRDKLDAAPEVDVADDANAAPIRSIRFEGTKVPAIVAQAAEAFVGQPARRATLQALAKAMSDAYAKSAVALYTVRVPEQDFGDGSITVIVAEGHIEGVAITGDVEGRKLTLVKAYADRLVREKPLTRAKLERYLSLIRDIPGLIVDAKLLQGVTRGGTRLVLTLKQRDSQFSAGLDNRTTQTLGDAQVSATAKFLGLLRDGDQTDITASASTDLHDYRYASIMHSTPLGTDGTRLGASFGYLVTRPEGSAIRGEAQIAALTVSHPLIRSYKRNLTLVASLDGVNSDNAAFGTLIAQEHSRAIRGAAAFSDVTGKSVIGLAVTLSQGLDILDARVVAPFAETRFRKVNVRASYDRALSTAVTLRLRASGQESEDRLPAVERFAVGGAEFGRAFDTAIITADRGIAGLAEIGWRPGLPGAFAPTELYTFVDGAKLGIERRGPVPGGNFDLASAGAGIRLAYTTKAVIELEGARSIDRPYQGFRNDWRVSVSWRLSLRK